MARKISGPFLMSRALRRCLLILNSQFSILNWKDSVFPGEFGIDLVVGVAGKFLYEGTVHIGVQTYLVPVFLVPVESSFYCGVMIAQFQCAVRVTFQDHYIGLVERNAGKYLAFETEYHNRIIKRHILCYQRQAEAVFAEQFYIHNVFQFNSLTICFR